MSVSEFLEGDRVRHDRYGLGEVVRPQRARNRVNVEWDDGGTTSVLACNLRPTSERRA